MVWAFERNYAAMMLGVAALFFVAPHAALADTKSAAELFRTGQIAFERGDFIAAAHAFEQAFQEAPAAASLYNSGLSWQAAGDDSHAATAYARALSYGNLADSDTKEARSRLASLTPRLGVLSLSGPENSTASVAFLRRVALPTTAYLAPGKYTVVFEFGQGSQSTHDIQVERGATVTLRGEAPVTPSPSVSTPVATSLQAPLPPSPPSTQRILGWSSLGLGAVASGVAVYLGVSALSARTDFADSGRTDVDAHDRAARLQRQTDYAFGAAFVLGGVGLALVLSAPSRAPTPGSQAFFRIHPAGVSFAGQF